MMKHLFFTLVTALISFPVHATQPQVAMPATEVYKTLTSQPVWLNTARALTPEDLKGRILLVDFWTYCCINCIHVIPDLQALEKEFGHKLTVISVHSAKFKNEQDTDNIRSAILRYGIEHAVANDFDFSVWTRFGIRAWPTFLLINPDGLIEEIYSGEGHREEVARDVQRLLTKYGDKVNTSALPMQLEKSKQPVSYLRFPGKIIHADGQLFISDSGHNRIVIASPEGEVREVIGSGAQGLKDGGFTQAQFNSPQGMAYAGGVLYVADTQNHSLRAVDLKAKTVTTIAGTGKQGYVRDANNAPALKTALASPWDVAFYPDDSHLVVAMAGTHQLWSYDVGSKTVSVVAGSGAESIEDGAYPRNSLSQPSGMSVHDGKLYFVDAETSSLRVFDGKTIKTLIGTGLFDFGFKDGKQGTALMQHSLGVFADASGVYVADSYNHAVRRYDVASGELSTIAGDGKRGAFNEPNDVERVGDTLYVADTNASRIDKIDLKTRAVTTLAVAEKASVAIAEGLPNTKFTGERKAKAGAETQVMLSLPKGWHINAEAPSYAALFEGGKAVRSWEKPELLKGNFTLPKLDAGKTYRLQGTFYYCEDHVGAQCEIASADLTLEPEKTGESTLALSLK